MQQVEIQEKISKVDVPESMADQISKWGCSISEAILDFKCQSFTIPEIDGFIGYQVVHECAIVTGDPICSQHQQIKLAEAFQKYCEKNQWNCIYFIVSEAFAKLAMDRLCKIQIGVGDELIFDPFIDLTAGHKNQKLRNTIHHAQHFGFQVKEYLTEDKEIEKKFLEVGKAWLKARKGPQIYLANLDFFENRKYRRWFYLEDGKGEIQGIALLTKVNQGWLLKFHITVPDVPRGSSELLMTSILDTLREENCRFLTYGIVPMTNLKNIVGINPFIAWLADKGFRLTKWIFRLGQRNIYWQKFHPRKENAYLLFSHPKIGLKEIKALTSVLKMDFSAGKKT